MKLFTVEGKKAIVTGSTRGLGRSMAEALLENGAEVVIVGSTEKVHDVARSYQAKGYLCHGVQADLATKEGTISAFNMSMEHLGGHLDILVTAAGIQRRHKAEEFPISDWNDVLNVNLNSVFLLNQLAGVEMLKKESGKIINVASMLSFFGGMTVPAYAASKGGVAQLTKALSNEWTGRGININAIAPGYMDTDMNVALVADENRNREILNRIPAKRWGTPDDMKGVTLFLASQASDYLSGAVIPVDGGYLSR